MRHDRFAEHNSFNVLGFIQLLYDTTCLFTDFWVKPVWGLGCVHVTLFSISTFIGKIEGNYIKAIIAQDKKQAN